MNSVESTRRGAPGSKRSLSQRIRSTSTAAELEQARRRLTGGRTQATPGTRSKTPSSSPTSRPIRPKDVADRYDSRGSVRPKSSVRGADGRASDGPSLSSKRGITSRPVRNASDRSNQSTSNAARIENVRRNAAARSAAARTESARVKNAQADESRNVRIKNARVKAAATDTKARSNRARIDSARQSYTNRIAAARRKAAGVSANGRPIGGRSPIQAVGATGRGNYGVGAGFQGSYGVGFDPYYNSCFWNYWGGSFGYGWGSLFCSPFYASGLCFQNFGLGGFNRGFNRGFNGRYNNCIWLGPFIPAYNSFIIYDDPEPEIVYVEVPAQEETFIEGEAVVDEAPLKEAKAAAFPQEGTDQGLQRELNRAASYYLTQGDRAFRESRFGDAAHFYAKAVEFSSDSGILYLVLSDALFATGDYRYAAYALRQAFEKEPSLAQNLVDKRDFYSDPALFERQLTTLEAYVEDHVLDMDARLVLAANYLFGGRPDLCLSLMESPFSEGLRGTPEGILLQQSATNVMFGDEVEETPVEPNGAHAPEGSTEF